MPYDVIVGRSPSDLKQFGKEGLVYLGKSYVKMGPATSLTNPILMDVARSHVVLVAGKRGSGKSYTLGVLAEEMANLPEEVAENIAVLIYDTMGIFWTMNFANEKESELLRSWNLESKKLPVRIFVPFGYSKSYEEKGIPVTKSFALKVSELSPDDWIMTFGLHFLNPAAILIQKIVSRALEKFHEAGEDFDLDDLILDAKEDAESSQEIKNAAVNLFEGARTWGLFAEKGVEGTEVREIIEGGKTSIVDLSCYSSVGTFNVRALVIGLLSKKLFNERMSKRKFEEIQAVRHGMEYLRYKEKREMPLVWIFIDECLSGNTEIITEKAHTPMKEVVERFQNGEKLKVLGYDKKTGHYGYYEVINVFSKGKRPVIKLTTESGKELKCTPEHRVLTRKGFMPALNLTEIASPIIQSYSADKELIKARLLGHLFGDGWASAKTKSLGFSGKVNPEDLIKIKKDLELLGLKSGSVLSRKTYSKITNANGKELQVKGTSHSIQASTKAFNYFLKLGAPTGEKALNETKIPDWLMNASKEEKSEFLAALMGSDGNIISKVKRIKGDFNPIRLSFNKADYLEKNILDYANQLKRLFEDVGISIGKLYKRNANIRKDGKKTIQIILTIKKNVNNVILFLDKVGYRYCEKKEIESKKWLAYLKARNYAKEKRGKIQQKAREMKKTGLGKIRIARYLQIPEYEAREWIYYNSKPGVPKSFPDFDEWINTKYENNILYEKVIDAKDDGYEEVYDISVDTVHNFVSNGLITHNCHEFLPNKGKTPATDVLVQILREGRQPGLSMALATQQPGKVHSDVMTQSDIVISHRVTSKPDMEALNMIMQTYLLESITQHMNNLPRLKGSAIILDDNSERIYPMRVRARFTWHGGEAPTAIKVKERL